MQSVLPHGTRDCTTPVTLSVLQGTEGTHLESCLYPKELKAFARCCALHISRAHTQSTPGKIDHETDPA